MQQVAQYLLVGGGGLFVIATLIGALKHFTYSIENEIIYGPKEN